MKMKIAKSVEAYIKMYPPAVQKRLKQLRQAIRKTAKSAVESISYGMVGYKLAGRPLVYFGGFKKHLGFFAMPSARSYFKKELSKYQGGKSAVQFQNDEPLPLKLVEKLVKFRMKENLKRK